MSYRMDRERYAHLYGLTTGDRIRLADTDLFALVEADLHVHGDEASFGGGKSIRDGMARRLDPGAPREGDAYQQEVPVRFPAHLGLSADALASSDFANREFGSAVIEQYALAAQWEWKRFQDAVTDWELDRYFESI